MSTAISWFNWALTRAYDIAFAICASHIVSGTGSARRKLENRSKNANFPEFVEFFSTYWGKLV